MKEMFREPVRDMKPYNPPLEGRSKGFLLLDFNERTIPPHPLVLQSIKEYVGSERFQIYPEYGDVNKIVADYAFVEEDQVCITNGSDQGIDIVVRGIVSKGDKVILPVPTFAMLEQSAKVEGADIISPRYSGENLDFPLEEVMNGINEDIKLVIVCNPNNPTGTVVKKEQLDAVIKKANKVNVPVLVDEAYSEFSPENTVADLVGKYANLFVTRSLSKIMGVASLRAGYVISQKQNIEELKKIRGPYDVNMVAVAAMMALKHPEVVENMQSYVKEVMEVLKPMLEDFYTKNGIKFFPSGAGFHLLEDEGLYEFLKSSESPYPILVRPRSDPKGTVRVSIGTRDDTAKYMLALTEYLKKKTA